MPGDSVLDMGPSDMSNLISVDQVSVTFEGTTLLAPVSFGVDAGQALAVTGANGTGKTTLLRVLAGLTRPSGGAVAVDGVGPDERRREFRALVAALIGVPPLARNLTVREHLVLVAASWGFSVADAEERADQLLVDFGIAALSLRFPHELSSGQTQLFSLALTLSRRFQVLLLDEPEQRLDTERQQLVGRALRGLVNAGRTLVLSSHSPALVEHVADRIVHLRDPEYAQGV